MDQGNEWHYQPVIDPATGRIRSAAVRRAALFHPSRHGRGTAGFLPGRSLNHQDAVSDYAGCGGQDPAILPG